jgi:hypothetical protein
LLVSAIFIAVLVLDADFQAVPGPVLIRVVPVGPASVRAVPISVPSLPVSFAIDAAIAARLSMMVRSPIAIHVTVIAAHTVVIAAMHSPVAAHPTVVGPRLIAASSLILLLLGVLVSLGRSAGLRNGSRRFSLLLGE